MTDVSAGKSSTPSLPAAGWYDDRDAAGQLRYWDGTRWTDSRVPRPPAQRSPEPPEATAPEPPAATPPSARAAAPTPSPPRRTRTRDLTTSLLVGVPATVGGLLVVVGVFPDFVDGYGKSDMSSSHEAVELLPGLVYLVLGVLALVGLVRFASPVLLGVTLGYVPLWLHLPLQVVDIRSLQDLVLDSGSVGFYLQALGIALATVGAVIGLVVTRPQRTASAAATTSTSP